MRLVVTGSSGFVGSVFALRAAERDHEVIGLDDESRGLNGPLLRSYGVKTIEHDCRNPLPDSIDRVDAVAHFAAGTGSLERPIEELRELNVQMTLRMVEQAKSRGSQFFLWPTTSLALAVPDSPYVQSKEEALAELLRIKDETADQGLRIVPARFFNIAGAYKGLTELRKNEVHLLPKIVECFKTKTPLTVQGTDYQTVDGTPSRDFVNVIDVVDYLLDIAEERVSAERADDAATWIGTGRTTTVRQAVGVVEQFFGDVPVVYGPRRAFDTGEIRCQESSVASLMRWRQLTPAWVSIRDEVQALLK